MSVIAIVVRMEMQTPIGQTLVALVAVAVFLLMAQRAQTYKQHNRANAMRFAAAGTGILALNAGLRMFGIDIAVIQSWIALVVFACMALAGVFLVRSALRNETMLIRDEIKRQADAFKKAREVHDKPPTE